MKFHFIIYTMLISYQFFLCKSAIFSILSNTKMFNISYLISLSNNKIRRIWFSRKCNIIWIDGFILIINIVQIQEVSYLHFLIRFQYFILNSHLLLCSGIYYFTPKLVQFTSHSRIVCLRSFVEELIQISPFIRSFKI